MATKKPKVVGGEWVPPWLKKVPAIKKKGGKAPSQAPLPKPKKKPKKGK